jgi:hypothetical protein
MNEYAVVFSRIVRACHIIALFGVTLLASATRVHADKIIDETVLPKVTGPIAGTPFNGNAVAHTPLSLARLGYDEEEYFISGRSNVYDWLPSGNFTVRILRSGPYTTRIVVHKPTNPRRWNGTAVVEIVNMTGYGPNGGFDYPGVWANNWREITRQGTAYVGITSKPNIFESLRRFDEKRYAGLSMANPLPPERQTCGNLPGNANYNPNQSKLYENGLIYDAFSQLGALLHSDSPSNPLGAPAQRVYMLGLSQSAGYLKTYLRFIAPHATLGNGDPIYNGYRAEGAVARRVPDAYRNLINQCATPLPASDPQLVIPDRGVPMIELHSSADFGLDLPRQPDGLLYRLWEVSGTFHDDMWTFRYGYPNEASFKKALPKIARPEFPKCTNEYPPDPPYEDIYDSSLRALDEWVRFGTAPPHVAHIQDSDGTPVLDRNGNPLGGLRLPAVDVPLATYRTEMFEPTANCSHKTKLPEAELQMLYPTHSRYVQLVGESLRRLVEQRLLTPEDALQQLIAASNSNVP